MDTASRLAARLDELASALARAGARPEQTQRLLETASLATLHAVSLDLLTASRALGREPATVRKVEPVAPLAPRLAA